jgi:hypothetical protein
LHHGNPLHRIYHIIYQATRDEAVKAGLLIMRALAEEYVQGKCSKEDLKPKKKEQFKSMVALAKRSPPTSAKAAAMKRPAAGAAVPSAKKPAAGAAAEEAARPAAQPVPVAKVAKKPAAAGAAEGAAAAAAARTSSAHVAQPVPAAALEEEAAEAEGEEEGEEESEEVIPYVQLYMFSQSGMLCMFVVGRRDASLCLGRIWLRLAAAPLRSIKM